MLFKERAAGNRSCGDKRTEVVVFFVFLMAICFLSCVSSPACFSASLPAAHRLLQLLPRVVGNVGFIFTNGELGDIRDVIEAHRVPAPARVGSLAPIDVMVPPGPTGCDPGQTSFFQVLQVREGT